MSFQPPRDIPEEEYQRRVKELLPKLQGQGTSNRQETNELFLLYNDRNLPRESGKNCAGCRMRVFKRMLAYYETIKGE